MCLQEDPTSDPVGGWGPTSDLYGWEGCPSTGVQCPEVQCPTTPTLTTTITKLEASQPEGHIIWKIFAFWGALLLTGFRHSLCYQVTPACPTPSHWHASPPKSRCFQPAC